MGLSYTEGKRAPIRLTSNRAATLAAGRNTISLAFAAAQASSGFLNLDRALLTKQ